MKEAYQIVLTFPDLHQVQINLFKNRNVTVIGKAGG